MENHKKKSSNLERFNDVSLTKKDHEKISGGFLFRMIDDVRCGLDRSVSRLFGGNGDGDW